MPAPLRLWCHGTRYVRHGLGWYAYGVRTVSGALEASCPEHPVPIARRGLVRGARTYSTEALGRTCKLSSAPSTPSERRSAFRLSASRTASMLSERQAQSAAAASALPSGALVLVLAAQPADA